MMKTANALLEELLDYVAPPRGCAIYLAESDPRDETETNWASGAPPMPNTALERYTWKLAELRLNVSYLIGVASRRTLNFALGEAVRSACAAGASQSWRSPDAIGVPGRSVCPTIGVE